MHSKISFLAVSQVAPLQPFRKKSSSIQTVFLAGSTEIKPLRLLVVQQLQLSALTFESEYEPLPVFHYPEGCSRKQSRLMAAKNQSAKSMAALLS